MKLPVHPSSVIIPSHQYQFRSMGLANEYIYSIQYTILIQGGIWCLGPCKNKVPQHPMVIMLSKQQSLGDFFPCLDKLIITITSKEFWILRASQALKVLNVKRATVSNPLAFMALSPSKGGQPSVRNVKIGELEPVCEVIHMLKGHISVTKSDQHEYQMAPAFFEQFCHPGHDLKTSVDWVACVLNHHLMFCRLACGIPQLGTFFGQA